MNGTAKMGERRMTVRDVAEVLGVTDEAIKKHVRDLWPNLMQNGITTYLSELHVTEIKQKMIPTTKVIGAMTDIEAGVMAVRVMEHFKVRFEQERELRIKTENKLAIAEPKAQVLDKITATENDVSVRGLAAILAVPRLGQNRLFQKLREDGYIDGFKHPYRQYIESGIMYEKEYYVPGLEATKQQLRITQKGVAYFARKYGRKETA
jgi:phage antirepressor YoqD-like protein